jgi:small subunit ribosomal protein S21
MAYYQKGGPIVCKGNTVTVGVDGNVEKAMRKFKKKVLESGLLRELKERETYEKPTTRRKKAKAAAKNRWRKKVASEQLPKKLY